MSDTTKYAGPVRPGMKFERIGGAMLDGSMVIVARSRDDKGWWRADGQPHTTFDLEGKRGNFFRPVKPTDAAGWALFLPDGPLADTGPKVFEVGQVYALWHRTLRWGYVLQVDTVNAAGVADSVTTLAGSDDEVSWLGSLPPGNHAREAVLLFDVQEPAKAGQSAQRQPVAPWARCGAKQLACYLSSIAHGRGEAWRACGESAAYSRTDGDCSGACESCAERAGVFGPVAIPALPAPAVEKPRRVYAPSTGTPTPTTKTLAKKPCPGCGGVPFKARRCGLCGLASEAEPARVTLAPIGQACKGEHVKHEGQVLLRVLGKWRGVALATKPLCDGCYLYRERETAKCMPSAKPAEPPARVGTVPQVFSVGVGIWASRGMRYR